MRDHKNHQLVYRSYDCNDNHGDNLFVIAYNDDGSNDNARHWDVINKYTPLHFDDVERVSCCCLIVATRREASRRLNFAMSPGLKIAIEELSTSHTFLCRLSLSPYYTHTFHPSFHPPYATYVKKRKGNPTNSSSMCAQLESRMACKLYMVKSHSTRVRERKSSEHVIFIQYRAYWECTICDSIFTLSRCHRTSVFQCRFFSLIHHAVESLSLLIMCWVIGLKSKRFHMSFRVETHKWVENCADAARGDLAWRHPSMVGGQSESGREREKFYMRSPCSVSFHPKDSHDCWSAERKSVEYSREDNGPTTSTSSKKEFSLLFSCQIIGSVPK